MRSYRRKCVVLERVHSQRAPLVAAVSEWRGQAFAGRKRRLLVRAISWTNQRLNACFFRRILRLWSALCLKEDISTQMRSTPPPSPFTHSMRSSPRVLSRFSPPQDHRVCMGRGGITPTENISHVINCETNLSWHSFLIGRDLVEEATPVSSAVIVQRGSSLTESYRSVDSRPSFTDQVCSPASSEAEEHAAPGLLPGFRQHVGTTRRLDSVAHDPDQGLESSHQVVPMPCKIIASSSNAAVTAQEVRTRTIAVPPPSHVPQQRSALAGAARPEALTISRQHGSSGFPHSRSRLVPSTWRVRTPRPSLKGRYQVSPRQSSSRRTS